MSDKGRPLGEGTILFRYMPMVQGDAYDAVVQSEEMKKNVSPSWVITIVLLRKGKCL